MTKDIILLQADPENNKKFHQSEGKVVVDMEYTSACRDQENGGLDQETNPIETLVSQHCDEMEMSHILNIVEHGTETVLETSHMNNSW